MIAREGLGDFVMHVNEYRQVRRNWGCSSSTHPDSTRFSDLPPALHCQIRESLQLICMYYRGVVSGDAGGHGTPKFWQIN